MKDSGIIRGSGIGSLKATLELRKIGNQTIPFQNQIPYPSFEPQDRMILTLAGEWRKKRFDADHDWSMSERDKHWIEETEKQAAGITASNYDDSSWETKILPLPENRLTGKEEAHGHGAETYENGVWYRRTFHLDEEWSGKYVTLKCLGLSYIGDFWINGSYVGYHEGGYTPFAFDVTPYLKIGENTIVIRVDNPPWTSRYDTVPCQDNDFFNYTGVIHDIFLEATEGIHVVRSHVVPKNTHGDLDITVVIENRTDFPKKVTLTGKIFDTDYNSKNWLADPSAKSICNQEIPAGGLADREISLSAKETKVLSFSVSIPEPKLWSIRAPHLYVLALTLADGNKTVDVFYTQFGIRILETDKAKIYLNDEPVFLAGIARHEEWPNYGRTTSWERIREDFLQILDLSVNMVRTAHYPNHIYTYIMLDRLGLAAMCEIPLWQFEKIHYQVQEIRGISYQMWREMVFSNYNRPSIIMWSTQNESKEVALRKAYNEKLVYETKNLYPDGRLITQSAAADQPGPDDDSMEPLDVAGWTMYFGIFHGGTPYDGTRNFIEQAHRRWPDKPIINTEYGIWSNADGSFLEKQIDIYKAVQSALLEKATVSPQGFINADGYVAAIDYWTAFDWYVNHNRFYQTMGVFHMDRKTKKPLYDHFVRDHRKLLEKTNGIGKTRTERLNRKIPVKSQIMYPNGADITFDEPLDLSQYNYLKIRVFDPENSDGFIVNIKDLSNRAITYKTFEIRTGEEYDVFVPLWGMDEKILQHVVTVTVEFSESRQLKILQLECRLAGC